MFAGRSAAVSPAHQHSTYSTLPLLSPFHQMHMTRETTFKSFEVLLAFPHFPPYLSLHITIETKVNLRYYSLRSFPMLVTTEATIVRSYYSYRPHNSTLCTLLCRLRLVFKHEGTKFLYFIVYYS